MENVPSKPPGRDRRDGLPRRPNRSLPNALRMVRRRARATANPLRFNVTAHPTSFWTIQQLREAFPGESSLRYLIHDNDCIFSARLIEAIGHLGLESKPTAYRSPWQNGTAERWIGSVRRELLDHVIVLDERHLRRLLREYVDYYNDDRVHRQLRDSPTGRPTEDRPSLDARIVGLPRVGGLHHRYAWREAA